MILKLELFYPEPTFQGFNHLPVGMRVFQVHVERGKIGSADPFKSTLTAPEFNAAYSGRSYLLGPSINKQGKGWRVICLI